MKTFELVVFERSMDIRNVSSLPAGLGCKYLLCLRNGDTFIAKKWCRKIPKVATGEVVLEFPDYKKSRQKSTR